jgi:hypothetical protein
MYLTLCMQPYVWMPSFEERLKALDTDNMNGHHQAHDKAPKKSDSHGGWVGAGQEHIANAVKGGSPSTVQSASVNGTDEERRREKGAGVADLRIASTGHMNGASGSPDLASLASSQNSDTPSPGSASSQQQQHPRVHQDQHATSQVPSLGSQNATPSSNISSQEISANARHLTDTTMPPHTGAAGPDGDRSASENHRIAQNLAQTPAKSDSSNSAHRHNQVEVSNNHNSAAHTPTNKNTILHPNSGLTMQHVQSAATPDQQKNANATTVEAQPGMAMPRTLAEGKTHDRYHQDDQMRSPSGMSEHAHKDSPRPYERANQAYMDSNYIVPDARGQRAHLHDEDAAMGTSTPSTQKQVNHGTDQSFERPHVVEPEGTLATQPLVRFSSGLRRELDARLSIVEAIAEDKAAQIREEMNAKVSQVETRVRQELGSEAAKLRAELEAVKAREAAALQAQRELLQDSLVVNHTREFTPMPEILSGSGREQNAMWEYSPVVLKHDAHNNTTADDKLLSIPDLGFSMNVTDSSIHMDNNKHSHAHTHLQNGAHALISDPDTKRHGKQNILDASLLSPSEPRQNPTSISHMIESSSRQKGATGAIPARGGIEDTTQQSSAHALQLEGAAGMASTSKSAETVLGPRPGSTDELTAVHPLGFDEHHDDNMGALVQGRSGSDGGISAGNGSELDDQRNDEEVLNHEDEVQYGTFDGDVHDAHLMHEDEQMDDLSQPVVKYDQSVSAVYVKLGEAAQDHRSHVRDTSFTQALITTVRTDMIQERHERDFGDMGINMDEWEQQERLKRYRSKYNPRSLGFMSTTNPLRWRCIFFMEWKWFDRFILATIAANCAFMASDDPIITDANDPHVQLLRDMSIFFQVLVF